MKQPNPMMRTASKTPPNPMKQPPRSTPLAGALALCLPLLLGYAIPAGATASGASNAPTTTAATNVPSTTAPPADPSLGQLVQVKGTVFLSQDALYTLGREGAILKAGHRLMALEGAEALIRFTDHCQFRLGEAQLLDIGDQSPCALGQGGEYPAEAAVLTGDAGIELQAAALESAKGSPASSVSAPVGSLAEVKGVVRVNDQPVRPGAQLHRRNPITTGPDGEATLKFTDGQIVRLRPSSQFTIHDYQYSSQEPVKHRAAYELPRGGLSYSAGAMAKENPYAVTLTTPYGVIKVHAADFAVSIGSLLVQVTSGAVTINGEEIHAGQYVFVPDGASVPQVFESLAELQAAVPEQVLAQASTLSTSTTLAAGQTVTLTATGLTTTSIGVTALGAAAVLEGVATKGNTNNDPISVQP